MSVNIIGDKSLFLSKNAIIRLKKDVKEDHMILESKKYLKSGYVFKIDKLDDDINITLIEEHREGIMEQSEEIEPKVQQDVPDKDKQRDEIRKQLKNLLNDSRKNRSGETKRKLMSLKRSIPSKIFDSYANLITKYKLDNIPAPDEVINNVDKYRFQISATMSNMGKVCDDPRVGNDIKQYFTALGNFLGIEPINIKMDSVLPQESVAKHDSDTEDEDD